MACKYIIFAAVLTVAKAGVIGPTATTVAIAQPTATVVRTENYDANPQYSYSYSVADDLTGDNKAQEETRNGNTVQGSYSLVEPDGSRRIVSYSADPVHGFNAVVKKDQGSNGATSSSLAPIVVAGVPVEYLRSAAAVIATGSPALRQSVEATPSVTTSNIITANGELIGAVPLGFALQSLYGVQPVIASSATGIVGIH